MCVTSGKNGSLCVTPFARARRDVASGFASGTIFRKWELINSFVGELIDGRVGGLSRENSFTYKELMGEKKAARKTRDLLELFYPIHYKAGMALEDAMRGGVLTRKQVAVLWLLRAEGGRRTGVRRKDIERAVKSWFEISSSAITKSIRKMARAPLKLVEMVESPDSGREKRVFLTLRGEAFIATMVSRGESFLREIVEQLPDDEVERGIEFLRNSISALETVRPRRDGAGPASPRTMRRSHRSASRRGPA